MKRLFTNAGDALFDSKAFFPVEFQDSARGVVVIFVRQQNVAQMAFAEDYDMINAFPSD